MYASNFSGCEEIWCKTFKSYFYYKRIPAVGWGSVHFLKHNRKYQLSKVEYSKRIVSKQKLDCGFGHFFFNILFAISFSVCLLFYFFDFSVDFAKTWYLINLADFSIFSPFSHILFRGVFRTLSNIYDIAFLQKWLLSKCC